MQHVEAHAPGELLNQDAFNSGDAQGVGKIYGQVLVDAFCSLAFAKVYTSTMPWDISVVGMWPEKYQRPEL